MCWRVRKDIDKSQHSMSIGLCHRTVTTRHRGRGGIDSRVTTGGRPVATCPALAEFPLTRHKIRQKYMPVGPGKTGAG